jgi:hypothetical protein
MLYPDKSSQVTSALKDTSLLQRSMNVAREEANSEECAGGNRLTVAILKPYLQVEVTHDSALTARQVTELVGWRISCSETCEGPIDTKGRRPLIDAPD